MYRTMNHALMLLLVVGLVVLATVSVGSAQQGSAVNKLRESPRQETQPVVPISPPTIGMDVWLNKPCGSPFYTEEKALIYFKTNADGYVTIYDIDTQGKVLVIFPNENTPDNYVKAGQGYQIPAREAGYDLIVEGPEGIEYIDAVASTDSYYHWDYRQGEPRWLKDWGLKGQKQQEVRTMDQSVASAFQKSTEVQNLPKELGEIGKKSLTQNFQLSQNLREQVQSKLAERPRETTQPTPGSEQKLTPVANNYSTTSCYLYVVNSASKTSATTPSGGERRATEGAPKTAPAATPRSAPGTSPRMAPVSNLQPKPRPGVSEASKITPVSRTTIAVDLWLDKQCGSPYYTGEKALIYFSTDVDGYVTLYDIDTEGQVSVIFPNRNTPDNFVKGGQPYQIPAREADYDLIVEGPEGIEYIDAVASTNPTYRWNYNQGEPRWLQDWGIKGRQGAKQEVRVPTQSTTASGFKESSEFRTLPKEFGAIGQQSVTQNFQISRKLQEQVRSQIAVTPRESGQTSPGQQPAVQPVEKINVVAEYSTASCYFYVVAQAPQASSTTLPSNLEYLRQQERDLQQIPNFEVRRLEDRLIVEMPARVLFDVNSFDLRYEAKQDLEMAANILLRYPDTDILVMGHTDSNGSEDYNQRLSESRAMSVANYLLARGVQPTRVQWLGYGETQPVASNYTDEGRQRNRRVELDIRVNEQYRQQ